MSAIHLQKNFNVLFHFFSLFLSVSHSHTFRHLSVSFVPEMISKLWIVLFLSDLYCQLFKEFWIFFLSNHRQSRNGSSSLRPIKRQWRGKTFSKRKKKQQTTTEKRRKTKTSARKTDVMDSYGDDCCIKIKAQHRWALSAEQRKEMEKEEQKKCL